MRIAQWYFLALLCIPFYIGPELVPNAQLNAERTLIAILALSVIFTILRVNLTYYTASLAKGRPITFLAFALFFTWRAITAILSPYPVSTLLFVNELMTEAFVSLLFFSLFFTQNKEKHILKSLKISVIFIFIIVCIELTIGENPFTDFAPENAGTAINSTLERAGAIRTKGTFEHPLTLAYYIAAVLPFFLFGGSEIGMRHKWIFVILLTFMALTTGSRTIIGIILIEFAVFVFLTKPKIRYGYKALDLRIFLMSIAFLSLPFLIDYLNNKTGMGLFSSYARYAQIVNGLTAIWNEPLFGYGQGPGPTNAIELTVRYGDGSLFMWNENFRSVDNWFLSVALSSGLPALLFLLLFFSGTVFPSIHQTLTYQGKCELIRQKKLNLKYALILSCVAQFMIMSVLSIFTLHPLFFIFSLWLIAIQQDISLQVSRQNDGKAFLN